MMTTVVNCACGISPPNASDVLRRSTARGPTCAWQYGQTLSSVVMNARQFGHMRRLSTGADLRLYCSVRPVKRMEEQDIYAVIGQHGFERLVAAFYRQIPGDDVLGPIYPAHDLHGAEQRLRDFLIFRFGGPPVYLEL